MFDLHVCSPDSPVDSAMFPPVYNRSSSSSSTASSASSDTVTLNVAKVMPSIKQELEPFDYAPHASAVVVPTPRSQAGTSLSSVFGDQDLVDAIMCSLTTEPSSHSSANVMSGNQNILLPAFNPSFTFPRRVQHIHVSQPHSFTALMQQRPLHLPAADSRMKSTLSGPCLRKPGTFLNKDGRWIKGKPCRMEGCDKRAQSNGLCKGHGGGARCNFSGCNKSSQGGGFCRAHGGGKRCMHEGCEKGTQRNGFCYLHGGVRSCSVEGCDKKDRGNGKCFSHGGGRKCQAHMCFHTTRRGAFCDLHNTKFK
ncbi:hypothetical protein PsorP6_006962 [Peronosclerospora sorghi]|uniref:Uncharacterized protein n=1 Tax=Peronosclerospora sorghi TaxID=230839 RepID=A0ACC0WAR9_9STRA|nr:hypothetical protein PsorP6_006962 [Peronosclerospora sorghi]